MKRLNARQKTAVCAVTILFAHHVVFTPLLASARTTERATASFHSDLAKTAKGLQDYQRKVEGAGPEAKRLAARASAGLRYLQIAGAGPQERHALIRALPVTVQSVAASDGRNGVMRTYVARGRAVFTVFVPAGADVNGHGEADAPDGSMPKAERPTNPLCTDEEFGPGECPTEWELDDALILIADLEAEEAILTADLGNGWDQQEAYCNTYGCLQADAIMAPSGPNEAVEPPCLGNLWAAGESIYEAVTARTSLWNKVTSFMNGTGNLSRARLALAAGTMTLSGAAAVLVTSIAVYCVYTYYYQEPLVFEFVPAQPRESLMWFQ